MRRHAGAITHDRLAFGAAVAVVLAVAIGASLVSRTGQPAPTQPVPTALGTSSPRGEPTHVAPTAPAATRSTTPVPTASPDESLALVPMTENDVEARLRTIDASITLVPVTDDRASTGDFPDLVFRPQGSSTAWLGVLLVYSSPAAREAVQSDFGPMSINGPSGIANWDGVVHSEWVGVKNVLVEVILPGGSFGGRSPTPSESVLPILVRNALASAPASSPSATPNEMPSPVATPIVVADPALLAASAWTYIVSCCDDQAYALYFGRLDGRAFELSTPRFVAATSKPADNGSAIAWWRDQDAAQSVVVLLDTATGNVTELYRTRASVTSAAMLADGTAWYWIEISGTGANRAAQLRRQHLPGGEIEDLRRVRETGLQLSLDGRYILLIPPADGNSDCPPETDARVWDRATDTLWTVPSAGDVVVGLLSDTALVEGWCGTGPGIRLTDRTGLERTLKPDGFSPGLYVDSDGTPTIAYYSLAGQSELLLFKYSVSAAEAQLLYPTGQSAQPAHGSPALVRNSNYGAINVKGFAPLFPNGAVYLTGEDASRDGDAARLLVNLDTGEVVAAPAVGVPFTVTVTP